MRQVTLEPKTLHGRNVVWQHGAKWDVVEDLTKSTTYLLLASLRPTFGKGEHDLRRVKKNHDPNFVIKEQ